MGMWAYRVAGIPDDGRPDVATAIRLLTEMAERGVRLAAERPLAPRDVGAWSAAAVACLVGVYGRSSPNAFSLDGCPGADADWAGIRGKIYGYGREVAEAYLVSMITERVRLMQECIVALRSAQHPSPGVPPAVARV